jgi:hypothetical protein
MRVVLYNTYIKHKRYTICKYLVLQWAHHVLL